MRNVPKGPHEPNERGTWWNRMGWESEEEYAETLVGPCSKCGSVEILDDHRGARLCQDCWHAARESETPYAVYRISDGYCACNGASLKEEAEAHAAEMTKRDRDTYDYIVEQAESGSAHYASHVAHWKKCGAYQKWPTHEARPCGRWWGDRIAHNGYMASRRTAVITAHSEYGRASK